ncbi:MAG: acyl-CoA synthetase [Gammaproteobacteria bacterium]|nr:acyl-CoA synthetase [Gammaproteobacteria bacterium]
MDKLQYDLSNLRQKLCSIDANSWLLSSDNSYLFLLGFLVLTGLNKTVIICANRKLDWLESLSEQFDAILSDEILDIRNKTTFDFNISNPTTESWFPFYKGDERVIFFTSGSTGLPKSVEKKLIGLINEVTVLEKTFLTSTKRLTFVSSVSHLHIYGFLFKLLWPLMTDRSWINRQIDYPEQLLDVAKQFDSIVFISSPAFLSRLDLSLKQVYLNKIFSSGGLLSLEAASQSEKYFTQLPIEVYGSTETGGIAYRQQHHADVPWTPFTDVQLEKTIQGIELSSPYILENTKVILDDRLEFNNSGQFTLKGRKDRVVKLEEKRVSLTEIEQFLEAFDTIDTCVAIIVPGHRQVIGCVLVLSQMGMNICCDKSFQFLVKQWKQAMKERFEAVTIPRKWHQLSEIPINSQSKIDTGVILAKFE